MMSIWLLYIKELSQARPMKKDPSIYRYYCVFWDTGTTYWVDSISSVYHGEPRDGSSVYVIT